MRRESAAPSAILKSCPSLFQLSSADWGSGCEAPQALTTNTTLSTGERGLVTTVLQGAATTATFEATVKTVRGEGGVTSQPEGHCHC